MSITIRGLDQLYRKLGSAAATQTLEPPMQRSVLRLQRSVQLYPPSRPTSEYVRTGTLGRRWLTRLNRSQSGLSGSVGTNVPYAPYVQSARFQTRQHRAAGWPTDLQALRQNESAILDDFQHAVDRALAS